MGSPSHHNHMDLESVALRVLTTRKVLRAQAVIATASLNASDGERHPSVCRGLPLSDRAMALSSIALSAERSVVLGKY